MQNDDTNLQTLGQRLKTIRTQAGMTQTELAEKLGSTQASINCYESDKQQPTLRVLVRLSNVFHLPIDYIATGENKEYYTVEDRYFLAKFHRLDERGRKAVLAVLESEHIFSTKE